MTTKTRLTINELTAAFVDIGDGGTPGSQASKITCEIIARRDGRWEAEGYYSTGCNQGYYQENYGHGPWRGRGDTPGAAVAAMVSRADSDYQSEMRRAGHDAMLECDAATFASLARVEADRIESLLTRGEKNTTQYAKIGRKKYYIDAESRDEIRRRAVKILRRLSAGESSSLALISDDDLVAEVVCRGLTVDV